MSAKNETISCNNFQILAEAASKLLDEQASGTKKEETQPSRKLLKPKIRKKLRRLLREDCEARKHMILPYFHMIFLLENEKIAPPKIEGNSDGWRSPLIHETQVLGCFNQYCRTLYFSKYKDHINELWNYAAHPPGRRTHHMG